MKVDSVEGHVISVGFDLYNYSTDWIFILKTIHLSHTYCLKKCRVPDSDIVIDLGNTVEVAKRQNKSH